MNTQRKLDFLIHFAYWAILGAGIYLAFKFVLPVSIPVILGILIAWAVERLCRKLGFSNRYLRLGVTVVIYGLVTLLVILIGSKTISAIPDGIRWFQRFYELKLQPFVIYCYTWCSETISHFDPTLISALEMVKESLLSWMKAALSGFSGTALGLVSGIATGIPSLVLNLLAMIFSTVFVVSDYERLADFARDKIPEKGKNILKKVRLYLTDTLFVVIRSYVMIMLLTFTELSILFYLFGIEYGVLKAAAIAVFDIMPILGTGGIVIPWAVVSLVLGYTDLGIKLLIIYAIVTVIRNYVEPKIVGTQLGLHPIITLATMFIGLRLFGFWAMFGLPVGISFLWKEKANKEAASI